MAHMLLEGECMVGVSRPKWEEAVCKKPRRQNKDKQCGLQTV